MCKVESLFLEFEFFAHFLAANHVSVRRLSASLPKSKQIVTPVTSDNKEKDFVRAEFLPQATKGYVIKAGT